MIHEIARELQAALRAQGCPLTVEERETTKPTAWRSRIVIEDDVEAGDSFHRPRSQSTATAVRYIAVDAIKVTIYAKSPKSGALEFEHRRLARHVRAMVLVALEQVAADRKNALALTGGRFVVPEDLADSERHAGAVYELTLTIERAVMRQTWAGEAGPEGSLAGVTSRTDVTINGAVVETACGGD